MYVVDLVWPQRLVFLVGLYQAIVFLNRLKIDASLVRYLAVSEDRGMIARAIIGLGTSLRLEVIAEGVEREVQDVFLRPEGCDIGRGHL